MNILDAKRIINIRFLTSNIYYIKFIIKKMILFFKYFINFLVIKSSYIILRKMSFASITNDKCCEAVRKWPSKKDAFKALIKERIVFLRNQLTDNGKDKITSYSRCSRKKKGECEYCWKHVQVMNSDSSKLININDITEDNDYVLATKNDEYFNKVKKKFEININDTKNNINIISIDDQNKIFKIFKSPFEKEFNKIINSYIIKIDKKNNSMISVTDSDDDVSFKHNIDSDNETVFKDETNQDEAFAELETNQDETSAELESNQDETSAELESNQDETSTKLDIKKKPKRLNLERIDALEKAEIDKEVEELFESDDEEKTIQKNIKNINSKLRQSSQIEESPICSSSDEEIQDEEEDNPLDEYTELEMIEGYKSKNKLYNGSKFYLNEDSKEVYDGEINLLGKIIKIRSKFSPFLYNKKKHTIVVEQKQDGILYNVCIFSNTAYDYEKNNAVGIKKKEGNIKILKRKIKRKS